MRQTITTLPRQGSILYPLIMLGAAACLTASLVIPFMMAQKSYVQNREMQRAREIASVCSAAQQAGLDPVTADNVEITVRNVVRGGMVADRMFFVPGMTEKDIPKVAKHLKVTSGKLTYSHAERKVSLAR